MCLFEVKGRKLAYVFMKPCSFLFRWVKKLHQATLLLCDQRSEWFCSEQFVICCRISHRIHNSFIDINGVHVYIWLGCSKYCLGQDLKQNKTKLNNKTTSFFSPYILLKRKKKKLCGAGQGECTLLTWKACWITWKLSNIGPNYKRL